MAQQFGNTQDLVGIETIQQDAVVLKDGSLRQIVLVGGVNFSLKSEAEQEMITQAYQNFLNGIDFPIQIVIHSRKVNIEDYLELLQGRIAVEPSELLQNQIGEYREFVREFVQGNPIMTKTFLVVVPFFPIKLPDTKTFSKFMPFLKKGNAKEAQRAAESSAFDLKKNLDQLEQRTNQVVEGLAGIDLEAKILKDEELIELFYNFYNPGTTEKENVAVPEEAKK